MSGVRGTDPSPISTTSTGYSLNDIIAQMQPPKAPSAFRRILGGVAAGVANAYAPGVGTAIGRVITGGGVKGGVGSAGILGNLGLGDSSGGGIGALGADSTQYLMLQQQITAESRAYEAVSSVMKAKHDASMAAIHNMH